MNKYLIIALTLSIICASIEAIKKHHGDGGHGGVHRHGGHGHHHGHHGRHGHIDGETSQCEKVNTYSILIIIL